MQKVKILKRVGRQLYRSSPTILTVVASIGVIATTITAVQATPKAIKLLLFYDLASKKYFRTTMAAVLNAQYHVNRNLSIKGDCSLNEYLSFLGVEGIDGGDELGWDISYMVEEMDCYWLDFDNYKSTLEDGLECIIIDTMAVNKFE